MHGAVAGTDDSNMANDRSESSEMATLRNSLAGQEKVNRHQESTIQKQEVVNREQEERMLQMEMALAELLSKQSGEIRVSAAN